MDKAVRGDRATSLAGGIANGPDFRNFSPIVGEKVGGVSTVRGRLMVPLPVGDNPRDDSVRSGIRSQRGVSQCDSVPVRNLVEEGGVWSGEMWCG